LKKARLKPCPTKSIFNSSFSKGETGGF